MSFLNDLVSEFTQQNQGQEQNYNQGQGGNRGYNQPQYSQQSQYPNPGPPQCPPPWVANWDGPDNRWVFINRETGERSYTFPQPTYGGPGYNSQQYGGGYEQRGDYYQQGPPNPNHSGRNMALGAVAGLAGGALLMHEGEKVDRRWDEDKYRAEQKFDDGVADVEYAPEEAAHWAGRKVQDVEDIPDDVDRWKDREEYRAERRWDDGVQDVEDAPEEAAGWLGRKVQDVEDIPQDMEGRFDNDVDRVEGRLDRVEDAYDDGRDQGRDDDRW